MIDVPDPSVVDQVRGLSPREREVAACIGRGLTVKEIAQELGVGCRTVKSYAEHLHLKLRTSSMAMIAAWAVRTGLVDHPEWFDDDGAFIGVRPS